MNDLNKIKAEYGDRLLIHGGWDSTGPHNFDGCTEDMVRAATRKALDDYARDGNFALFPIVYGRSCQTGYCKPEVLGMR